ncbi:MAG: ATP-dependent sacrificial sulfur transferase LarE [Chlorobi bacterium]|nr:ATP-dependent sacrificial sulfur transferase LarE [Chlorobiota bacterium]
MGRDIENKITKEISPVYTRLKDKLLEYGQLAVGYSGGTDSTLLLYIAASFFPGKVKAYTADTVYMFRDEIEEAKKFCREHGIPHEIITIAFPEELRDNPPERCYLCKLNLFSQIQEVASCQGYTFLADGTHIDDLSDYRPGRKALKELGIRSPLQEAGMTKSDIRKLAKVLGLPNWNRPANTCLLTRLPHNHSIGLNVLPRIEAGEKIIREMGFAQVRLRSDGTIARIEVNPDEIDRFRNDKIRTATLRQLQTMGFLQVTIDLEGYRSGKMNHENIKNKIHE